MKLPEILEKYNFSLFLGSSPRSSRSATTSVSQDSVPSKRSSSRRGPSVKEVAKKGKRAPEKRKAATPTTTDQVRKVNSFNDLIKCLVLANNCEKYYSLEII